MTAPPPGHQPGAHAPQQQSLPHPAQASAPAYGGQPVPAAQPQPGYQQPHGQPGYGYQYGPMPHYPTVHFPPPSQPPKRGLPAWVWVIASVLVVAVAVVWALPALMDSGGDRDPTVEPTEDPTDGYGQPNTSSSGTFTGEHMVSTINEALATKDRPAFFRFVQGDAVAPLSLWWDNMEVLAWDAAAFSFAPRQPMEYVDDTIELRLTLGAATPGSPTIPEESSHPDAGLAYAPSNMYIATIQVTDDGESGLITGWDLVSTAAPWDLEPLYAVIGEHSVVAGYVDDKELIDRLAPLADEAATWVIETYERETGIANAQRFTTFASEDPDRFNDWFIGETSGWTAERAGTMFPQRRPFEDPSILSSIAQGGPSTNAGGILTVGPNAVLYGNNSAQDTILHEFVHAMHMTNVPEAGWPGTTLMEGLTVYNESLFRGDGEFANQASYYGRMVRMCTDQDLFDGAFPQQTDFDDVETVHCAYALSGSMYAYAAELGADVYTAADYGLAEGVTFPEAVAATGGPLFDEAAWFAWLQENFGTS